MGRTVCSQCRYWIKKGKRPDGTTTPDGDCHGDVPQLVIMEQEVSGFDPEKKILLPPTKVRIPMPMFPVTRPDLPSCRHFRLLADIKTFQGDPPKETSIMEGIENSGEKKDESDS